MKYKLNDIVTTYKNEVGVIDRVCFDGYIVKFASGKYGFYTEEQLKENV